MSNNANSWDRSFIKCDPYVEREVRGRHGEVIRERNVEEMIRIFKKRVAKSGILDEYKNRRYYEKPSVGKRQEKLKQRYENDKRVEKEKAMKRRRDMGK